jgi:hypothetical protein
MTVPRFDIGRAGTVWSGAMHLLAARVIGMSIPMDPMMGSGRGVEA